MINKPKSTEPLTLHTKDSRTIPRILKLSSQGYGHSFMESKKEAERLVSVALPPNTKYTVVSSESSNNGNDFYYMLTVSYESLN